MPGEIVICVHGYLSHGAGMYLIKRRLEREYAMRVSLFSYPSVRGTLDENASALATFIREQDVDVAHIVGHSLGGVLALRMHARHRDIGVIAGNVPLGFGRLVADFDEDNDGTIGVSETKLDAAKDHLILPVSHKGMLVSAEVADQAAAFIKRGEFLRASKGL